MSGMDHLSCRKRVCVCCGSVTKKSTVLSQIMEAKVKRFAHPEYSREVESFPLGLDSTCQRHLRRLSQADGDSKVRRKDLEAKWKRFKMENIIVSRGIPHSCQLCKLVKSNPVLETPGQANYKTRGFCGEDEEKENKKPKTESICKFCLQKTGRGIPHKCSQVKRKSNLVDLFSKEPSSGQEQMLGGCIKSYMRDNNLEGGDTMRLNGLQGGNKVKVQARAEKHTKEAPAKLDVDFYARAQKKLNLSSAKVKDLQYLLRKAHVKSDSYVREKLVEVSREMEEFYEVVEIEMEEEVTEVKKVTVEKVKKVNGQNVITIEKKEKKETVLRKVKINVVFVKNLSEFVAFIAMQRNIKKEELVVRTSLDGGGGSFKIVGSIFKMPEPGKGPENFKGELDTGAGKLVVFCLVEKLQERYENMKILLDLIQLNKLEKNFSVMDLKVFYLKSNTSYHLNEYIFS